MRAPSGGLNNVNVAMSDLHGPGGAVISKTAYTLYREHYVYISKSSPNWGGSNRPKGAGWYPDGLIPFNDPVTGAPLSGAALDAVPFNLSANQNQPIWVDLLVPRTAAPGQYNGTFTVSSNQGTVTGQVSVTVWNFTLPLKPSLRSSFLFWVSGSKLAYEELLRHKLEPIRTSTSDQRHLIDNYGLGAVGLPFWSGADINTCTMSPAPSVSQFQNSKNAQQPDLMVYDYSADEIDHCTNLYETLKQWARNMHQAGVKNLVTMSPKPALYDDGSGTGRSAVDIWVLLPKMYDQSKAYVGDVLAKGDDVWSYNTLVQDAYSPKWLIDFDPMDFRIQPGFINQSLKLTGVLYWRVDLWSSDPWNNVSSWGAGNYPGEGVLIYPGSQVGIQGVAPSMRLKWLRDGVEDFEYVEILKKLGRGDWALQIARSVGADWTNWTRDPAALDFARQQLADEIERLSNPNPTPPPAPSNPSPANGATGVSLTPTLSWTGSAGATYDVYFGTASNPPFAASTGGTSYAPGTLNSGTTYYWRVVAKNSGGSTSSPTWSFTTGTTPPPAPSNPSPANGATGVSLTPTLSWTGSAGATYDVYFGTASNPPFATSTGGTSYAPGTLNSGTTYYWRVVAKNSGGSTTSPTWSLTTAASGGVNVAPQADSVTPSSGKGRSATFQFRYSDANGASDLTGAGVLINTSTTGTRACWFYYEKTSNRLWLADNTAANWSSALVGSSGKLENSQCSIEIPGVSVSVSGNNLTLTVPVRFKVNFGGTHTLYLYANDRGGLTSGYQARGTWTVPK